jgi:hypothetical protein
VGNAPVVVSVKAVPLARFKLVDKTPGLAIVTVKVEPVKPMDASQYYIGPVRGPKIKSSPKFD